MSSSLDTFMQLTSPQSAPAPANVPGVDTFQQITKARVTPQDQWKGMNQPSAMARLGRGFVDVTDGIQQMYLQVTNPEKAKQFQKEKDAELAIYEANAPEGMDWMRLGGQVAATAPTMFLGGPATTMGRMGVGAVQGAAASGSLYTKEDESRLGNATVGAVGGAAIPLAFKGLGEVGGRAWAGLKTLSDKGKVVIKSDEAILRALQGLGVDMASLSATQKKNLVTAARAQLDTGGVIDADAINRKTMIEGLGFTGDAGPTQAQLTRSPQQWAQERNLSKIDEGEALVGRFQNQDARFNTLRNEVIGQIPDDIDAGELTFNAVNNLWGKSQEAVSRLYKQVRNTVGDTGSIQPSKLQNVIAENIDNLTGEKVIGSVDARVGRLLEKSEGLTINQAEELRKWIGSLADGGDPNLQRLKRAFVDALDDDVIDSVGDDAFSQARDAARARFKAFETKLVNSIVEDKTSPDKAFQKVLSADQRDLVGLKKNLLSSPDGAAAWEQIRKQVIQHIWDKAYPSIPGAEEMFSGTNFQKALSKLGDRRLQVLFEPQEVQKLREIAKAGVAMTRTPPYSAVNWSNTAPATYQLLKNMGGNIPFLGNSISNAAESGIKWAQVNEALAGLPTNPGLRRGLIDLISGQVTDFSARPMNIPMGSRVPPIPTGISPQGLLSPTVPLMLLNQD